MEYHCSDDKTVASRIFERGLDSFGAKIDYVLRYLSFLISINDENNARALFERVIPNFSPDCARPLWERWARYEYQYGDLEAALKLEKRMAEVYSSDPPIKRFAQRHMYLGIDAIADRDLGFALARKPTPANPLGKSETQHSLLSSGTNQGTKRGASPDYRNKREDNNRGLGGGGGSGGDYNNPGNKRMRASSPPRGADRDRETRWEVRRRPFSPPPTSAWDRDDRPRAREPLQLRTQEREEEKPRQVSIPSVISWFVGDLPASHTFDGPVFRTDDLLNLFRNAVIPSMTTRADSPPRSGGGGRPPPDYGPYQGPNSGRGGRRY